MSRKKAVILDNEWVIVRNDWDNVARAVSEEFGVPIVDGREFKKHLEGGNERLHMWSKGTISYEDFWGSVLADYDVPATPENIERISSKLEELTTDADEGVLGLVRELRGKGVGVYILSNATPEIEKGNRRKHDYFKEVDGVYYSHMIGARKPEPAAYWRLLKGEGLRPNECVFVDDKPKNVRAAEKVGMDGVEYKIGQPVERLRERLREKGVDI